MKKPNTREDCIYRYKNCRGIYLCNCMGSDLSDETIKRWGKPFGWIGLFKPSDARWNSGGFVLNNHNPSIDCRSCKYYTNNYNDYDIQHAVNQNKVDLGTVIEELIDEGYIKIIQVV